MAVVIETEDLTKEYPLGLGKATVGVNGLTISVEQGETFGLVGPNGSGKTTTLKLLLGLLYPTRGKARVFGKDPAANPDVRERIGFLPDGPYFYDYLTAEEILGFYAELFGLNGETKRKRVQELLEQMGMTERKSTKLGTFSKGMVQRIGLAQALLNDPDLVLLDEPTTGLDPLGSLGIRDIIAQMKQQGKTVFLCSHLLDEVQRMCDRVAIIHRGQLLEVLEVSKLTESLEDVFVRSVGMQ